MVAIFTGAGTGLERGSGNVLGGAGLLGSGATGRSGEQVMLNAATGNLLISQRDEFLVGRGPDAVINRTYNSLGDLSDDNGDNWRQSTQRQIRDLTGTVNTAGSTVKRMSGDGSLITYSWNGTAYRATDGAGAYDTITYDGTWRWTDGDSRIVEVYGGPNNQISQMTDTSGVSISYVYSGGKLAHVATSNGERIEYVWSGNNIAEIRTIYNQGGSGLMLTRTRYEYDGSGRLANVAVDLTPNDNATTDGNRYVTSYTYHGTSKLVASISETDGTRLDIGYDGSNRVVSLVHKVSDYVTRTTTIAYGAGSTVITDAHGQVTTLNHDGTGQLTSIVTPPPAAGQAALTVSFGYNGNGDLTSSTTAAGTTTYQYDANGNLTYENRPAGNGIWRTYNAANQMLVEMRGGADEAGDNIQHSTRYVYDEANRLRFTVDAKGGVTEYGIGPYGRTEYTRTYVAVGYDISGLAWNTPLSHAAMTDWANNTDKTGNEGAGYVYDDRSNLIEKISYGTDAVGAATPANGYTHEYFTYDQAGQLLNRRTAGMNAETFVYDGLGRVKASTDSAGATTSIVFNDAASQTVVTLASGLVRTSTYNRAGELIHSSESGAYVAGGATTYEYDALGRMRKSTDPNGLSTYVVYDKVGRKLADVNQWGWMREYRYDAADRLVATIRYTQGISASQLAQIADPAASPEITASRPSAHVDDIWHWTVYDAGGRVVETIAGDGSATRFDYDNADRLIRTTQFATKLGQGQIDSFRQTAPTGLILPPASVGDSVARTFYDAAGRVVGTLDGEGWLTRTTYDKAGRAVADMVFHNPTDPTLRATGTFNQLVASVGSHALDVITRQVYDGQGNLRFSIDGLNRVTEHGYQYDTPTWSWPYSAFGPERSTTRYAGTIAALSSYTLDSVRQALSSAGLVGNASNRVSYAVYDHHYGWTPRLLYTVDTDGSVTGYGYDVVGRITRKTHYNDLYVTSSLPSPAAMDGWAGGVNGNPSNRTERYYYNARGELRFTIDAEGYVTRNDYDAGGRLAFTARWTNPVSATDGWTIDTVAANQSGDWAGTWYEYNVDGQVTRITDAIGNTHDYGYYGTGKLAWDIASNGHGDQSRTLSVYDASGRLKQQYAAVGTPEQAITSYGYDGRGNLVSVTDANGRTTTRAYDKAGQLIGETNAASGATTFQYDALGNQVRVTDANGNASYKYYDKVGRMVVSRDAESYATEYAYDVFGDLVSTKRLAGKITSAADPAIPPVYPTGASDAATVFEYDKLGRLVRTVDAEGHTETRSYNAFGDVNRITNKIGGITDFIYYRRGQLHYEYVHAAVFDSNGSQTATGYYKTLYQYDSRGNVSATFEGYASPAQRVTTFSYDKSDRLIQKAVNAVQTVGALDHATISTVAPTESYAYDKRGNLVQVTDPNGARTLFYYDDQDRRVAELSAVGTLSHYTYDAVGNVLRTRVWGTAIALPATPGGTPPATPGGDYRDTVHTYDNINRLLTTSVENVRTGRWNGSSFALAIGTVTTSYQYDAMGNIIATTDGNGVQTLDYHDRLGRRIRAVDGEGYMTGWVYDAQGNVVHERRWRDRTPGATINGRIDPPVSSDDRITDFAYDRNGRRIAEHRYNVEAYGVDGNGTLYGNTGTSTIAYTYNGLGEVTTKTEATGDLTLYQYRSDGSLFAETRPGYVDATGATAQPLLVYYYDTLGNLILARQTAQGGGAVRDTRYFYDAAGRLSSMQDAAGATTSYHYDAAGNLLRQSYQRIRATDNGYLEAILYKRDVAGRVTNQTIGQWNGSAWVKGDGQNMQYNAYGELARRGTNGGWQEEFHYDATGQVWKSNAGDGVWRYFVHDGAGNRTLALESEGMSLAGLTLDQALGQASGNFANALGANYIDGLNVTIGVFDRRGQQTATWLPKRQLSGTAVPRDLWSHRGYTAFGEVASETDANGFVTSYQYNTMGRLLRTVRPQVSVTGENGAVSQTNPTEYQYYDRSGRAVALRDANGNLTRRALLAGTGYGGGQALVVRAWQADGGVVTSAYDRFGDLKRSTDAIGRVTQMAHDALGRVTQITRPSGNTDSYSYDMLGQRLTHTDAAGAVETTTYDQQGRIIARTDRTGDTTVTNYYWEGAQVASGLGTAAGAWLEVTIFANGHEAHEVSDVFGHVVASADYRVGEQYYVTGYRYDTGGRLEARNRHDHVSNVPGEAVTYSWLNTGQLGSVSSDLGSGYVRSTATYGYDALGRRTAERFVQDGTQYRDAIAAYDALGRMTDWSDFGGAGLSGASMTWGYDAVGNIRRTLSNQPFLDWQGNVTASGTQGERWFRYDTMNRAVITGGRLENGQIVRGDGAAMLYDAAGQRAAMIRDANLTGYAQVWVSGGGGGGWVNPQPIEGGEPGSGDGYYQTQAVGFTGERRESYGWTADGALSSVTTLESGYVDSGDGYGTVYLTGVTDRFGGASTFGYDAAGRQTSQIDRDERNAVIYDRATTYDNGGRVTQETVAQRNGSDTLTSTVTNAYATSGAARGQIATVSAASARNGQSQGTSTTTNTYDWRGGAARLISSATSGVGPASSTSYTFGAANQLDAVTINDGRSRTVTFINDASGQALRRDEADYNPNTGDPHEMWYRFAGIEIGHVGNNTANMPDYATSLDIRGMATSAQPFGQPDPRYTGAFARDVDQITSYDTGAAAARYTVRAGDTLQGIALALWGDAGLWYKLATANGLGAASALSPGQTLTVPAGVVRSTYTASTLTPYDPSDTLGDVSPVSPQPQAKAKKNKCGAFGAILLIAVAVAVTVATHGAAANFLAGVFAGPTATAAAAAATATAAGVAGATTATIAAAGAAALGATAITAGAIVGGALVGIAANVVSQGVGLLTGIQSKFSWKGVAMAGISGGISGGLGSVGLDKVAGSPFLGDAARGALSNAAVQGTAIVTGLQSKFDWTGVAVGAAASGALGSVKLGGFGGRIVSGMAGAIAGGTARSLLDGSDFGDNILAALPDVIGSTIGERIGASLASRSGGGQGGPIIAAAGQVSVDGRYEGSPAVAAGGEPSTAISDIVVTARSRIESAWDRFWNGVTDFAGSLFRGSPRDNYQQDALALRISRAIQRTPDAIGDVNLFAAGLRGAGFPRGAAITSGMASAPSRWIWNQVAGVPTAIRLLENGGYNLLFDRPRAWSNIKANVSGIGPALVDHVGGVASDLSSGDVGRMRRGAESGSMLAIDVGTLAAPVIKLRSFRAMAAENAGSRVTTLVERVEVPNALTGEGYGVNNPPVRIQGEWTDLDIYNALYGRSPQSLGRPQLHHANQMPGSAIHEILAEDHLGNAALHPNKWNQGVTGAMRTQDTKLHWWYRAQEQGAWSIYPNHIYD